MFVLGDLNARVGFKSDYIMNDRPLIDHDQSNSGPVDLHIPRAACDRGSNRFGDCLLVLCKSLGMLIVNGRVGKDRTIGNLTCFTHNGESTVDYLLTSYDNFDLLLDFHVHDFNVHSNHDPVTFDLRILKYVM